MLSASYVAENQDFISSYMCCYTTVDRRYENRLANRSLSYCNAYRYLDSNVSSSELADQLYIYFWAPI